MTKPKPKPTATPDGIDLRGIVDNLAEYFRLSHTAWEYPDEPETLALWVIHAWFVCLGYEFTDLCTVYLYATSHYPDCGKTRLARALALVCPGAVVATPTVAQIVRFLTNPTNEVLLIDQFHNLANAKSTDRDLLNGALANGHSPGVSTMQTGKDGSQENYSTFFPKAFFGLASYRADPEIVSRSIRLRIKACIIEEFAELQTRRAGISLTQKATDISKDIKRWVGEYTAPIIGHAMENIHILTLNDGTKLFNREADNWRMIFAIADTAGGKYPHLIRDVAARMSTASITPEPELTEVDRIDAKLIALAHSGRLPVDNWFKHGEPPLPNETIESYAIRNSDLGWINRKRSRPPFNGLLPAVTLCVKAQNHHADIRILPADLPAILTALEIDRTEFFTAYRNAGRLRQTNDKNMRLAFRSGDSQKKLISIDFATPVYGKAN